MPLRIFFLILAFVIFTNLVIMLLGYILNENLYQKHGRLIANSYGIFALILIIGYFVISLLGLE